MLRGKTRDAVAGNPPDEVPFQALAQLLKECPIPERFLEDHLRGFALDEIGWQPASEEDLALYCYYVAGAVGCMMAILMGVPPEEEGTLETAAALGIAFQLSNIARDVREDLRRGGVTCRRSGWRSWASSSLRCSRRRMTGRCARW